LGDDFTDRVRYFAWTDNDGDADSVDPTVSNREWYRRRWAPIAAMVVASFVIEPLWHHFL
jgi:hypothetical protein